MMVRTKVVGKKQQPTTTTTDHHRGTVITTFIQVVVTVSFSGMMTMMRNGRCLLLLGCCWIFIFVVVVVHTYATTVTKSSSPSSYSCTTSSSCIFVNGNNEIIVSDQYRYRSKNHHWTTTTTTDNNPRRFILYRHDDQHNNNNNKMKHHHYHSPPQHNAAVITLVHRIHRGGGGSDSGSSEQQQQQQQQLSSSSSSVLSEITKSPRSLYVHHILSRRYRYVQNGSRQKDILKWLQQRGGDPGVFSMHGVAIQKEEEGEDSGLRSSSSSGPNRNRKNRIDRGGGTNVATAAPAVTATAATTLGLEYTYAEPVVTHIHEPYQFHTGSTGDPFAVTDRMNLHLVITPRTPLNEFQTRTRQQKRIIQKLLRDDILLPPTTLQLSLRTIQLLFIHFFKVILTSGFAIISKSFRERMWYPYIVTSMGSAGAAWIKWGQWASTRQDIFPPAFCHALSMLHNQAPIHSFVHTKTCMEYTLGIRNLYEVFESFEPVPIASGSIAQVHRATLRLLPNTTSTTNEKKNKKRNKNKNKSNKNGNTALEEKEEENNNHNNHNVVRVAVKVRHPNVAQLIDLDFRIMTKFVQLVEYWFPTTTKWLRLSESIQQFSHVMAGQAALHVEGHHLEIFNANFLQWHNVVKFPRPFFASSSIIVETFEDGIITTELLKQYQNVANVLNQDKKQQQKNQFNRKKNHLPAKDHHHIIINNDLQNKNKNNNNPKKENSETTRLLAAYDVLPVPVAKFIVTSGVAIYLKMLLIDNLMHADLHPGNILVDVPNNRLPVANSTVDGTVPCDYLSYLYQSNPSGILPIIIPPLNVLSSDFMSNCLVDAGMVAQLTEEEAASFVGLIASIGEGDGAQAAFFALQFSSTNHHTLNPEEKIAFARDMDELFRERCRGYGTNVDLGYVLQGVLGLIRKHQIRIEANYATLVVNVLCIQGMAREVCPEYNVLDAAEPLFRAYRRVCLTADGRPIKNARRSKFVRLYLLSKYLQKQQFDNRFFQQLEQKRKMKQMEHFGV